jgi:hypothetical protein
MDEKKQKFKLLSNSANMDIAKLQRKRRKVGNVYFWLNMEYEYQLRNMPEQEPINVADRERWNLVNEDRLNLIEKDNEKKSKMTRQYHEDNETKRRKLMSKRNINDTLLKEPAGWTVTVIERLSNHEQLSSQDTSLLISVLNERE